MSASPPAAAPGTADRHRPHPAPSRRRLAVWATRSVNFVSRRLGLGSGTVIGGRAGLRLCPDLVGVLAAGRPVAVVSGTNGKTTTTRLLCVALEGSGLGPVTSNATGANMPAGHAAALAEGPADGPVVLEVDEGYLPRLVAELAPAVAVLLNLSRDQLDRTNEVRRTAGAWRRALADQPATVVVANADDPLVAWSAMGAPHVTWVAAGLGWQADAVGCPACEGRITFAGASWSCPCGLARPGPAAWLEEDATTEAVWADGRRLALATRLPGRFNRANTLMATVAAAAMGAAPEEALAAACSVGEVAGRFTTPTVGGVPTRLLLAKNPAGWTELLELVGTGDAPVVVGINARVADGRDPSWLWDVPFERLAGRPVVATGERRLDLSVRLRHAGVAHLTVADPVDAVRRAAELGADGPPSLARVGREGLAGGPAAVEFVGNYTAFHDLLRAAGGRGR